MTTQNTSTSSNASPNNFPLVRWGIALAVLISVSVFIYFGFFHPDDSRDEETPATQPIEEPVNVLEEEAEAVPQEEPTPEPETPKAKEYYVSPTGNDKNAGTSSALPFATIQKAVDLAEPGETIRLADGVYLQDIASERSGTTDKRITITGSRKAIVQGGGKGRVIEINHDYITLDGFTIDGHFEPEKRAKSYREKLIFALGKDEKRGVEGLRVLNMTIRNARGECIRLRYFAVRNEIARNTIENCGVGDFVFDGGDKNGEGIYIGTALEQRDDETNPTDDTDVSEGNWIHHNTINTNGNECVDIKEGSIKNIVEHNSCTGQEDKESGGMGSRGNENVFRFNDIFGNRGAGIRLGGDSKKHGINNFVHDNKIRDNGSGGIKVMRKPQAKICGNTFEKNEDGKFVGEYGDEYKDEPCR